jgi:hypothetical protein
MENPEPPESNTLPFTRGEHREVLKLNLKPDQDVEKPMKRGSWLLVGAITASVGSFAGFVAGCWHALSGVLPS